MKYVYRRLAMKHFLKIQEEFDILQDKKNLREKRPNVDDTLAKKTVKSVCSV